MSTLERRWSRFPSQPIPIQALEASRITLKAVQVCTSDSLITKIISKISRKSEIRRDRTSECPRTTCVERLKSGSKMWRVQSCATSHRGEDLARFSDVRKNCSRCPWLREIHRCEIPTEIKNNQLFTKPELAS